MFFLDDLGWWRRTGIVGLTACSLLIGVGCASAKRSPLPSAADSRGGRSDERVQLNRETFDAAWRIIHETHYDTNFNGVDWSAVGHELRPKAELASTTPELRKVIQDMLSRLGQSHMALIPSEVAKAFDAESARKSGRGGKPGGKPASSPRGLRTGKSSDEAAKSQKVSSSTDQDKSRVAADGDVGLDVRLIGGRLLVYRVESDGPAERRGIRPGWVLAAVDGQDLSERMNRLPEEIDPRKAQFLVWRIAHALLSGPAGSTVNLRFLDGNDSIVETALERRKHSGELVKLGLMPPMYARFQSGWVDSKGVRAGWIHFNIWMVPIAAPFDRAVDQFRQADGMIIDLRGNLGGIGGMIMGLSGHFLTERISLGTMKMRTSEIHFFANPRWVNASGERVRPYSGPVAILTDSISLSAAEVFAGGMQSIGRARVFGESSGGQALPAVWDRLPNGDVLYHAFADFVTSRGVRLEGRGVIPDEPCAVVREDLLAGRDPVLQRALDWIEAHKNKQGTGVDGLNSGFLKTTP